jgi:hypothetical protein
VTPHIELRIVAAASRPSNLGTETHAAEWKTQPSRPAQQEKLPSWPGITDMDIPRLVLLGLVVMDGLVLFYTLKWLLRRGWIDTSKDRVRRGTGHALLGLEEFIRPSVEYVRQAEQVEQKEEDDLDNLEDEREQVVADLSVSLGRDPVDHDEVRRQLASALRAGLDWREVYATAVQDELTARPFRAPWMPPVWRVAPRE